MFETLEMLDRALLLKINTMHTPLMDVFMWEMSKTWHTFVFILIVAFGLYKKFSPKKAVEFVLGCALVFACTDFSSNMVKHSVKRYRPTYNLEIKTQIHKVNNYEGGTFGFFSGHAANTLGITCFIFLCLHWVQKKYRYLLFIYPLLICYSRMYLGVHYPSDIIVGILDGLVFANLLYFLMNKYFFKIDAAKF
jgi:undecaprenyl-diphosphatase